MRAAVSRDQRAPLAFLGFGIAATLLFVALPPSDAQSTVYALVGVASVAALLIGIRWHRPFEPRAWNLFAAGIFLFLLAEITVSGYEIVTGHEPPFPWYSDVIYLIGYPVVAFGIYRLAAAIDHTHRNVDALIDSLLVTVSAGALTWVFLMKPYVEDGSLSPLEQIVSLAYPAFNLVLLAFAARFLIGGGARQPALIFMLTGLIISLVTNGIYLHQLAQDRYQSGGWIDGGWLLAYTAIGTAALHPSMRQFTPRSLPAFESTTSVWRLAGLGLLTLSGPCILFLRLSTGNTSEVVAFSIVSALLFVLALARVGRSAIRLNAALDDRDHATEQLQISERRFRSAFSDAPIGMALVDRDGEWLQINAALCDMLGYSETALMALSWGDVLHPDDLGSLLFQHWLDTDENTTVEQRYIRHDGSVTRAVCRVSRLRGGSERDGYLIAQIVDVTQLKDLEEELRHLALHDPLTGLPNRTLLSDRIEQALLRPASGNLIAVLFLDLDRFKIVNDGLGHRAGDELLRAVAGRLSAELRPVDTLSRFGGDEFVILLDNLHDSAEAIATADRVLASLSAPFAVAGQEAFVSTSIGIAISHPGQIGPVDLVRHADLALYRAKAAGRSTYVLFDPDMQDESTRRAALETDLRRAIERNELVIHYQPIVELANGRIDGAEALVRWAHPRRGLIQPGDFISIAEETGLIIPLGSWVLDTACREAVRWQRPGETQTLRVNLSARQFRDGDLPSQIAATLQATGLPASALRLELTEQVLLEADDTTLPALLALKALGVSLSIDDFGTGYSSLGYLRHLPIDVIKIDRSFVQDLETDTRATAIHEAIVGMARSLKMRVTAEGIETAEQYAYVKAAGCDYAQGFYFSPPVTAEALETLLARRSLVIR